MSKAGKRLASASAVSGIDIRNVNIDLHAKAWNCWYFGNEICLKYAEDIKPKKNTKISSEIFANLQP